MMKRTSWWMLIAAVLLLCVQIIAVVSYIYSFIPYPQIWNDPFSKGVEPKRDPLFYLVFLFSSFSLMAVGAKWVLPRLEDPDNRRKFKLWLALESLWSFLVLFGFFKWVTYRYPFWNILTYDNPDWVRPFFIVVCILALLSKIFFIEIEAFYKRLRGWASTGVLPWGFGIVLQALFIAGVAVLLYIPEPKVVTALSLAWDQWNHLDHTAAWFIRHGWYFSYEAIIQFLVMMAIAYIVGLFYFIRRWLDSWLLASIGALLALKMGLFYYGALPCIWVNPANSFLSHGWDIGVVVGLWFIEHKYPKKFWMATALTGGVLVACWFKANGILDALGLDNQPLMAPLRVRQFFPYFMGFFVPVFYVASLLVLMGKYQGQPRGRYRLPIVFCALGLMIFIDYLEHPAIGFYGALMVPAILVMLWWLHEYLRTRPLLFKRGVLAAILVVVIGSLLTNRQFLVYPNVFASQDRFAQEVGLYDHLELIDTSAALITRLVNPDERAVVISNFETAVLMKAKRQPLFNDFPVMYSSLNNMPGGLDLVSRQQALDMIKSMADENAAYVFVDARLLALPPEALGRSGLNAVLGFVKSHYTGYTRQGFLVALARR